MLTKKELTESERQTLVQDFRKILDSNTSPGKKKELVIQDYLEHHSELIPTPNLLNHGLHFNVIVSQFPLDTSLVADYVYLTKSSDTWRITFVELETPDKKIFSSNKKQVDTSSAFNKALSQVRSWQVFLGEHSCESMRRLEPILYPQKMRSNPVTFDFQLIVGRSAEKNSQTSRLATLNKIRGESGVSIMTYDTLISYFENGPRYKKNILALTKDKFRFKHLHVEPHLVFSYVPADSLILTTDQKAILKAWGYEIEKWEAGDLLTVNSRVTKKTANHALVESGLSGIADL
ncbi:Shedu anti-phage system protein SduA domain-containing protein [Zooshikella ganghwensis]|uniref:Shedu anti-phage system protein SduA domain-containing protein n=1 Tax=Zooshikella ganghwensis TaxID=202772 RepID=UPI000423C339|nr:Shedu anti-phage system protein SduA domain-containing protein [Zooshikella ganghwensis]